MSQRVHLLPTLALLGLAACGEATTSAGRPADLDVVVPAATPSGAVPSDATPARAVPAGPRLSLEIGPQDPPVGVDPAYDWHTTLNVSADAGFVEGRAYGQAIMQYMGTNATADVKLDVTKSGTTIGTQSGHAEESYLIPAYRSLSASVNIPVADACGLTAVAHADGSAWNQALISAAWLSWGKKASSADNSASQSACTTNNMGGPGGTGTSTGYTTCVVVVYYDLATGAVLAMTPLACF